MTLPDPASTPVNDLADRFWEAVLELNPTTATLYGDERYADRLEDPSATGRARARALMERTSGRGGRHRDGWPADRGSDHPRHARGHRRSPDRGRRPAALSAPGRRPDGRPAAAAAPADPVPAGRYARATRGVPRPAPRLPGVHGREHRDPARGAGLRADRAAHRRGADDRPDRAAARGPDRVGGDPVDGHGRERGRPGARPRGRARPRLSGRPRIPRGASRRLPGRDAARTRACGRRPTATSCTGRRSAAGRRSTSIPRRSTGSGSTTSNRSRLERREISRGAGFGDDTAAYRAALDADPTNTPRTKDELVVRAHEDIDRAMVDRAALFRGPAAAACEVRAVEEYKERDAPFAYYYPPSPDGSRPGIYYANGYDLPSRKYTKLATTTYHEAVPGHHFQIALEMENHAPDHVPPPRGADGRGRVRRGLGPVQRAAGRRDGPLPGRDRALRDARRAGLAGRPARRRHGPPRAALAAPALDRLPQDGRPVRDRRR